MNTSALLRRAALALLVLGALALPGFSATTATLALSGSVAPLTSITVTPDPNAGALPLGTAVTNLKIATVVELSNNKAGYTVSLSTLNGAQLKESAGSDSLAYTLTYGGSPVSFVGSSATLTATTQRSSSAAGRSSDLAISFAAAFLNADSYTDTLTFNIAAN